MNGAQAQKRRVRVCTVQQMEHAHCTGVLMDNLDATRYANSGNRVSKKC